MANTEHIEARLCAYIDGELDAQGRSEIEQHLAKNPQHRQLLEQLISQRKLLSDLPREKAPGHLYEAFQLQLERSVLLGSAEQAEQVEPMRLSRWPQFFAVAAVLVMTVGLAAVIYFILPAGPARRPEGFAVAPTPSTRSVDKVELAVAQPAPAAAPSAMGGTGAPAAPSPAAAPMMKSGKLAAKEFADATPKASSAEKEAADALVVVVASADPAEARQRVTQYLESNQINWQTVSEEMPTQQVVTAGPAQTPSQVAMGVAEAQRQRMAESATQQSPGSTLPALANGQTVASNSFPPLGGALQMQQAAPVYARRQVILARDVTLDQLADLRRVGDANERRALLQDRGTTRASSTMPAPLREDLEVVVGPDSDEVRIQRAEPTSQPTGQAFAQDGVMAPGAGRGGASTQASSRPASGPATQMTERLNVMIVVEADVPAPDAAGQATSMPASMPASHPATAPVEP